MAGLFQLLRGQKNGTFLAATTLLGTDGEPLIIPVRDQEQITRNICTRPTAVDWDGDGDLDLIVGNFEGGFHLFTGEGAGKFGPKSEELRTGESPLRIQGAHSDPFVVDWDGDGDLDLLSGSTNGGVQWAENLGKPGQPPQLAPFTWLIPATGQVTYGGTIAEAELTGPTTATRVWVDDVNADGKLDILVGDNITITAPMPGVSAQESEQRLARWQEEANRLLAKLNGLPPTATNAERQQLSRDYSAHYRKRQELVQETRTGFVWLYVQK